MKDRIPTAAEIIDKHHKFNSLGIERIPRRVLNPFRQFARDNFSDDYGMALTYLWDNMITNERLLAMEARLLNLEAKSNALENKGEEAPKFRIETTVGGKKIKIPIRE